MMTRTGRWPGNGISAAHTSISYLIAGGRMTSSAWMTDKRTRITRRSGGSSHEAISTNWCLARVKVPARQSRGTALIGKFIPAARIEPRFSLPRSNFRERTPTIRLLWWLCADGSVCLWMDGMMSIQTCSFIRPSFPRFTHLSKR